MRYSDLGDKPGAFLPFLPDVLFRCRVKTEIFTDKVRGSIAATQDEIARRKEEGRLFCEWKIPAGHVLWGAYIQNKKDFVVLVEAPDSTMPVGICTKHEIEVLTG